MVTQQLETTATTSIRTESVSTARGTVHATNVRDRLIALALLVGAVLLLLPLRHVLVRFSPDEGLLIHGAERVLVGQVPYRDFFALVTPGSYYLLAAEFRLFGHLLMVPNTALILYGATFAALSYTLSRHIHGRLASVLSSYLVLLSVAPGFMVAHNWDSTFFAVLAVYSAHRFLQSRAQLWALAVGVATSITILFEQSKGAGLLLGLALAAIALTFCHRSPRIFSIQSVAWFASGLVIPLSATLAYFAHKGALGALVESVLWPLRHYSVVNRVPYGYLSGLQNTLTDTLAAETWIGRIVLIFVLSPYLLIPMLAAATVIMAVVWVWLRRKGHGDASLLDHQVLGGCIFTGIWLAVFATRRADVDHLIFALPLFGYLVPGILDLQGFSTERVQQLRVVIAGYMVVAFALFGLSIRENGTAVTTNLGAVKARPEVAELLGKLQSKIGGSMHFYVHPYQPFIYAATGTQSPTRFDMLFPGMSTPEHYRQAARELDADRTPLVLLDASWVGKVQQYWPSTPTSALLSDPVADYILQNYRVCTVLAHEGAYRYYLMARKNSACPQ